MDFNENQENNSEKFFSVFDDPHWEEGMLGREYPEVADDTGPISYRSSFTCAQFHNDRNLVRGIMGPIGSGKSVACCVELFNLAKNQKPFRGVRRSRVAVVRNTYGELKTTTIKTFQQWIPEDICHFTWGAPISAMLQCEHPDNDGTLIECEFLFVSMDRPTDVRKVLSLEITFAWLNEARELGKSIVDAVQSRLGRYPGPNLGGCTRKALIMDTNPPDDFHWWYEMAEVERPEGWSFFQQPGGLMWDHEEKTYVANPDAENTDNLPGKYKYYKDMVGGKDQDWINVYILGKYGSLFNGRPVYEHYYDAMNHVSKEPLDGFPGIPILLGWDYGHTPACIIGQLAPNGQLRILRELYQEGAGVKQFAQDHVLPVLTNDFQGYKIISTGDPAGSAGSQHDIEISCESELTRLGIPTKSASTNMFALRRQAVIDFLSKRLGDKPGLILDPSCEMLIKGFNGGYQYSRILVSGEERYRDVPAKNRFSHPADALQYLALTAKGDHIQVQEALPDLPVQPDTWGAFTS